MVLVAVTAVDMYKMTMFDCKPNNTKTEHFNLIFGVSII